MFRPLADRVLVQEFEAQEKTESGIYIPDNAKERPLKGKVIAVGEGKVENGNRINMSVNEGDTVMYGKFSGVEVDIEGEKYLLMREADIMGVFDGN